MAALRDGEERLRSLYAESQQREKVLVRRLAAKEQEMQDYVVGYFIVPIRTLTRFSISKYALTTSAQNIKICKYIGIMLYFKTRPTCGKCMLKGTLMALIYIRYLGEHCVHYCLRIFASAGRIMWIHL